MSIWIFVLAILVLIFLPVFVFLKLALAYYKAQAILEDENSGDSL